MGVMGMSNTITGKLSRYHSMTEDELNGELYKKILSSPAALVLFYWVKECGLELKDTVKKVDFSRLDSPDTILRLNRRIKNDDLLDLLSESEVDFIHEWSRGFCLDSDNKELV